MRIKVDISDYVTEGILSMECEDGKWRPVAFLSKSLNEIERNYEIHNKEMLVVIRGLENQRYLPEGVRFKFKVWINYNNLEYFMKVQKLNRRQAYWVLYLSRFDFILKYIPETKIGKTDGLSRRPNWKVGVEKDNKNQTLIKEQRIHSLAEVAIEESEVDIVEKVRGKDKEIVRVVKEMKKAGVKELKGKEQQIKGDLVLKEGKVYMLKDEELRVEIIQLHYDVPIQRKMKDNRISDKELLVTRDNKRYRTVCKRMQYMPKNKR